MYQQRKRGFKEIHGDGFSGSGFFVSNFFSRSFNSPMSCITLTVDLDAVLYIFLWNWSCLDMNLFPEKLRYYYCPQSSQLWRLSSLHWSMFEPTIVMDYHHHWLIEKQTEKYTIWKSCENKFDCLVNNITNGLCKMNIYQLTWNKTFILKCYG